MFTYNLRRDTLIFPKHDVLMLWKQEDILERSKLQKVFLILSINMIISVIKKRLLFDLCIMNMQCVFFEVGT